MANRRPADWKRPERKTYAIARRSRPCPRAYRKIVTADAPVLGPSRSRMAQDVDRLPRSTGGRRSVRSRKALPCLPFLRGCHPVGPSNRFGLRQTDLAHISPDCFARDGRWLDSVGMGIGQNRPRRGNGKQHQQRALHRACSFSFDIPRNRGLALSHRGANMCSLRFRPDALIACNGRPISPL